MAYYNSYSNYIYCFQLPDFECRSLSPAAPHYTVVKVGHSINPADRICEIMEGFKNLGASDTEFQHFNSTISPDAAIESGKKEPKIIFIKKCCASNEKEIEVAEEKIRSLVGCPCASNFQQRFESQIDPAKLKYLDRVGKTEWIIMQTGLMYHIQQQEYHRDWINQSIYQLTGNIRLRPTGEQFCLQLSGAAQDYYSSRRQKGTKHQVQTENTVVINFRVSSYH